MTAPEGLPVVRQSFDDPPVVLPPRPGLEPVHRKRAVAAALVGIFYTVAGTVDLVTGSYAPKHDLAAVVGVICVAGIFPLLYAAWRARENRRLGGLNRRRLALWRESLVRIEALRLGGRISVDEAAAALEDPAEAGDFLAALEADGKARMVVTEQGGVYYEFDAADRDAARAI